MGVCFEDTPGGMRRRDYISVRVEREAISYRRRSLVYDCVARPAYRLEIILVQSNHRVVNVSRRELYLVMNDNARLSAMDA